VITALLRVPLTPEIRPQNNSLSTPLKLQMHCVDTAKLFNDWFSGLSLDSCSFSGISDQFCMAPEHERDGLRSGISSNLTAKPEVRTLTVVRRGESDKDERRVFFQRDKSTGRKGLEKCPPLEKLRFEGQGQSKHPGRTIITATISNPNQTRDFALSDEGRRIDRGNAQLSIRDTFE
jgi:hypothetical protein